VEVPVVPMEVKVLVREVEEVVRAALPLRRVKRNGLLV